MTMTQPRLAALPNLTMDKRMLLGRNVRRYRKTLGLSQEKLAERAGCNRQSINRVENGAYSPSADRLFRLADALGLPSPAPLFDAGPAAPVPMRATVELTSAADPTGEQTSETWRALAEEIRRLVDTDDRFRDLCMAVGVYFP